MTIGVLLDILGIREHQKVFHHEGCPFGEILFPHMAHAKEGRDVPFVLNYVFDIVYQSAYVITEIGNSQIKIIGDLKRFSPDLEKLRKRHFSLKRLIVSEGSKTRKLLREPKPVLSTNPKNPDLGKILKTILDELKAVRQQNENQEERLDNLLKEFSRFSLREVTEVIRKTTMTQNKLLATEFVELKKEVKDLIEEVRIDPNNPKPTEIRTEENAKQILALSQRVVPLVEKVHKTLEEANDILRQLGGVPRNG